MADPGEEAAARQMLFFPAQGKKADSWRAGWNLLFCKVPLWKNKQTNKSLKRKTGTPWGTEWVSNLGMFDRKRLFSQMEMTVKDEISVGLNPKQKSWKIRTDQASDKTKYLPALDEHESDKWPASSHTQKCSTPQGFKSAAKPPMQQLLRNSTLQDTEIVQYAMK